MLRVVADSNIYISAFNFGGLPQKILQLAEDGVFELCLSESLIQEIRGVLIEKFQWLPKEVDTMLVPLIEISFVVKPTIRLNFASDPDDDRVLECAVAAKASLIVSGDNDLLRIKIFRGIPILSARQFISGNADLFEL